MIYGSLRLRESSASVQAGTGIALRFFKQAQTVRTYKNVRWKALKTCPGMFRFQCSCKCRPTKLQCTSNVLQNVWKCVAPPRGMLTGNGRHTQMFAVCLFVCLLFCTLDVKGDQSAADGLSAGCLLRVAGLRDMTPSGWVIGY
jgi:hypothetical protein